MFQLSDEHIARIFKLCTEIAEVGASLPAAPRGFDVSLELAKNLRASLNEHERALGELLGILTISQQQ